MAQVSFDNSICPHICHSSFIRQYVFFFWFFNFFSCHNT